MTRKFVRLSSEIRSSYGVGVVRISSDNNDVSSVYNNSIMSSNFPIYRLYINNELISERSWRWHDIYLVEEIQIEAEPGTYTLRYELVNQYKFENFGLDIGPLKATLGDVEVLSKDQFVIKS